MSEHQPITEVTVTEVHVETHGALRKSQRPSEKTTLSTTALVLGIISLASAPLFGVGVVPGVLAVITGHIAKHREPRGRAKAILGLGLSYVALVVATAVLVLVAIPLLLAFLVSTGYILSD
jgi:hypothetical protein